MGSAGVILIFIVVNMIFAIISLLSGKILGKLFYNYKRDAHSGCYTTNAHHAASHES